MPLEFDDSLFASIIRQSGQGVLIHRNYQPLFANRALADLLGYQNPEQICSLCDIRGLYADTDLQAVERFYQARLEGGSAGDSGEFPFVTAKGKQVWLSNYSFRISVDGEWLLCDNLVDITERRQIEQRNALLATVVEQMDDAVEITDADVNYQYVNPAFERITGYTAAEAVNRTPAQLLRPEGVDSDAYDDFQQNVIDSGSGRTLFFSQRKDGSRWISDTTVAVVDEKGGSAERYVAIKRDITDRVKAEEALKRSEKRFRGLMEHAVDAIFVHDLQGRFVLVNQQACSGLGYTHEELLQMSVQDIETEVTAEGLTRLWDKVQQGSLSAEGTHTRKDGSTFPVEVHIGKFYDADEKLVIAIVRDITSRRQYEQGLYNQAYVDGLTGLPNRKSGREKLVSTLVVLQQNPNYGALLFIDLDDFKKVNDTMGHHAGDQLLKLYSARLVDCLRESDSISRLGGDEFMVIATDQKDIRGVDTLVQRIIGLSHKLFLIEGREIFVDASIGISLFPDDSTNPDVLMRNADTALYRAKSRGRSQFSFFDPSMNEQAVEYMRIETELRRALECAELQVHYQPLVDAETGRTAGAEALLRWHSAKLGDISPAKLIPIAEQTGQIRRIGLWVLETACQQARKWQLSIHPDFCISVNVSAIQLREQEFAGQLKSILQASQLPPASLELELTESSLLDNSSAVQETLTAIKALGVRLAMDDFGTGYSSLNSLLNFHFDTLKIDRSFVHHIARQDQNTNLVRAIISMAQSLKLRIVAEGVETPDQRSYLQALGCDLLQGWLYSKALSPAEFVEYLQSESQ